jgi:hypothetical protein
VIIVKRTTEPTTARFSFSLGGETFTLARDESRTLSNVMPGTYVVTEPEQGAWRLSNLACTDPSGDSVVTIADRQASIVVAPGETVTCTFTNSPTGQLPATGNRQLGASLAAAVVLIGLGMLLVSVDWRRRRALLG